MDLSIEPHKPASFSSISACFDIFSASSFPRILTRRQIDEALNRKGIFYSHRTLERLLADIDMQPVIRVGKSGNAHTYTWDPS